VLEIDGHDMPAILGALDEAERVKGKPTMVVAFTTGKRLLREDGGVPQRHAQPRSIRAGPAQLGADPDEPLRRCRWPRFALAGAA
jgi:transketolase